MQPTSKGKKDNICTATQVTLCWKDVTEINSLRPSLLVRFIISRTVNLEIPEISFCSNKEMRTQMKSSKYTIHYVIQFILQTVLDWLFHHLSDSQLWLLKSMMQLTTLHVLSFSSRPVLWINLNWFWHQQNSLRTDCTLLPSVTRNLFWVSIFKEKVILKHNEELLFKNFHVNSILTCCWYLQILITEC